MRFTGTFMILLAVGLLLACSARPGQLQANAQAAQSGANKSTSMVPEAERTRMSESSGNLPLRTLSDVPLTGGATRMDYQSLDSDNGKLYIAHLGSALMTVFHVNKQTVIGDVKD